MKNLDVLVGAKDVELVAFREHSYRKGCEVIKHVGEIKNYDSVVYDSEGKCVLFLKSEKNGKMEIVDRLQSESIVDIRNGSLGGAIVLVD